MKKFWNFYIDKCKYIFEYSIGKPQITIVKLLLLGALGVVLRCSSRRLGESRGGADIIIARDFTNSTVFIGRTHGRFFF
jgi:hypothetical protein